MKAIKKHAVMMEYVIIAVLVAAAVVVAVVMFGRTVKDEFNVATTSMVSAKDAKQAQSDLGSNVKDRVEKADKHANGMNDVGDDK